MIYFLYIGMIFTDLKLANYIGTLGLSPMFIISSFLFLIMLIKNNFKLNNNGLAKYFYYYLIASFLISLLIAIYYFIIYNEFYTPFGNLILIKLFKASMYNFVYFLVYYLLVEYFVHTNIKTINKSIFILFIITLFIGIIELIDKSILDIFHLQVVEYSRLRLLTSEPSRAALQVVVLGLIVLALKKNKIYQMFVSILMLLLFVLIASKGSVIFLLLSIFLTYIFSTTLHQKINYSLIIISFILMASYFFMQNILPELSTDIEKFTSFSTRITTYLWSIISLFQYPLGEGYGTYLCYFQEPLKYSMKIISNISPIPLNYIEVNNMLYTGLNVGVKSGILFQVIQAGLLAVLFFYIIFKKINNNLNYLNLDKQFIFMFKVIFLYEIFTLLFGVNMEVLYIYLLPIAYIDSLYIKSRKGTFK